MCNKWIAAVANFLLPGAGYLYVGRRDTFAWGVTASYVLLNVGGFMARGSSFGDAPATSVGLGLAGALLLQVIFAYDAYKLAEGMKKKKRVK